MLAIYWVVSRRPRSSKMRSRIKISLNDRKQRQSPKGGIKVCGCWGLTWCRRKSRRIVCRALIFTDFSTYSEQVALKSSLAALERDGRTRRWSIAVISCETSAELHSKPRVNHAPQRKGGSHATHLQRKATFPSVLTVARTSGWGRWSESSLLDPAPKILTNVSAHFTKNPLV